MPDHTHNPSGNAMQCNEFDALLSDALDGILKGERLERFQAHARVCQICGPLFAEAEAGHNWLKELTEVEAPAGLIENILASTTGIASDRLLVFAPTAQPRSSWLGHLQASISGALQPIWETVRQPRFAMSFGMAFFSLSVALSVAGVRPSDLREISLRPAAIRHTYYNTEARVVRYYENMRLVYEIQARVREVRRTLTPAEPEDVRPERPKEHKNDTTQQPEQKQERNYSQAESPVMLARAPLGPSANDLPVVSRSSYRRLV
jgi:Putative zinc-finger